MRSLALAPQSLSATRLQTTGLKIPVSGVQFSPCPPFFLPAKRRNPALGLSIRHIGSHEPRGMPCDPLGPFLIAHWVPVWVPVFWAVRLVLRVSEAQPGPPPALTSFEPEIFCSNRPARTAVPTLLLDPLRWFRLE